VDALGRMLTCGSEDVAPERELSAFLQLHD
jgi:hypothetical protein